MKSIVLFHLLLASISVAHAEELPVRDLIEKLPLIEEIGFGYSALFSGSKFLPLRDSGQWSTGVLGSDAPKDSEALTQIVERGADAIPFLVKHLDDQRPTKIKPISGMMWMGWNDEYDYNNRIRVEPPKGVNRDTFGEDHHPSEHQITVGDLCFVALGQIVNRNFAATRYQPTGGLIVSSPTYSKALMDVVRNDYSGMNKEKHRKQLVDDFTRPDHEFRRNGAAMRLAFYYPELLDDLVTKQLATPTFNVFRANDFVRDILYRVKSPKEREQLLREYEANHGAASRDGILLQLFDDLDTQIADEEGRLHPPLNPKYDARNVLVQHFGHKDSVTPKDRPYVDSWAETERARFIESLRGTTSPTILKEVYRVFSLNKNDDYLALACIKVLQGNVYDKELITYCRRRIEESDQVAGELVEVLNALANSKVENAEQGGQPDAASQRRLP